MLIKELTLKNFRCFPALEISFEGRCIVVQGKNGVGKSSVLEALHYSCYLRSFRTNVHKDLITLGNDHFFIQVEAEQQQLGVTDSITVGFSLEAGKLVKQNEKPIQSYKELLVHYRLVTLAADDLMLVHGAPEGRRDFLNYALFLLKPDLLTHFKRYKQIVDHRNSILRGLKNVGQHECLDELEVWSQKLWEESLILRQARIDYLRQLDVHVNQLLQTNFAQTDADLSISFEYVDKAKAIATTTTFEDFWRQYCPAYLETEQQFGRGFFGAHLDDFVINFQNRKARVFASRGQQKLITFLIKVAQLLDLGMAGEPGVLLLDDFLTDFDDQRIQECFGTLCGLPFQIILTCPTNASVLGSGLALSQESGGFSVVPLS